MNFPQQQQSNGGFSMGGSNNNNNNSSNNNGGNNMNDLMASLMQALSSQPNNGNGNTQSQQQTPQTQFSNQTQQQFQPQAPWSQQQQQQPQQVQAPWSQQPQSQPQFQQTSWSSQPQQQQQQQQSYQQTYSAAPAPSTNTASAGNDTSDLSSALASLPPDQLESLMASLSQQQKPQQQNARSNQDQHQTSSRSTSDFLLSNLQQQQQQVPQNTGTSTNDQISSFLSQLQNQNSGSQTNQAMGNHSTQNSGFQSAQMNGGSSSNQNQNDFSSSSLLSPLLKAMFPANQQQQETRGTTRTTTSQMSSITTAPASPAVQQYQQQAPLRSNPQNQTGPEGDLQAVMAALLGGGGQSFQEATSRPSHQDAFQSANNVSQSAPQAQQQQNNSSSPSDEAVAAQLRDAILTAMGVEKPKSSQRLASPQHQPRRNQQQNAVQAPSVVSHDNSNGNNEALSAMIRNLLAGGTGSSQQQQNPSASTNVEPPQISRVAQQPQATTQPQGVPQDIKIPPELSALLAGVAPKQQSSSGGPSGELQKRLKKERMEQERMEALTALLRKEQEKSHLEIQRRMQQEEAEAAREQQDESYGDDDPSNKRQKMNDQQNMDVDAKGDFGLPRGLMLLAEQVEERSQISSEPSAMTSPDSTNNAKEPSSDSNSSIVPAVAGTPSQANPAPAVPSKKAKPAPAPAAGDARVPRFVTFRHHVPNKNRGEQLKTSSYQPNPSAPVADTSSGPGKRKRERGRPGVFPQKIHQMLGDLERLGMDDIASFLTGSKTLFAIHKNKEFVNCVMPTYFNTNNFASFQRQMNMYGFKRMTEEGPENGAYYHELFVKNQPFLSTKIKRKQANKKCPKNADEDKPIVAREKSSELHSSSQSSPPPSHEHVKKRVDAISSSSDSNSRSQVKKPASKRMKGSMNAGSKYQEATKSDRGPTKEEAVSSTTSSSNADMES